MKSPLSQIKNSTKEPQIIFIARKKAYEQFISLPIPSSKDEGWKYTDISSINFDYSGKTEKLQQGYSKDEKGMIFTDIKTAMRKYPNLIIPLLNESMLKNRDKIEAMNNSQWSNGMFIYVTKGNHASLSLNTKSKQGTIYHNILVLEESSTLEFFEEWFPEIDNKVFKNFKNNTFSVYMKENSKLEFYKIFSENEFTSSITNITAYLEKDSFLNMVFCQKGGKLNRAKIEANLIGEGAEASISGFFIGEKEEQLDITTNLFHKARSTKGDILIKGALNKKSTSVFRGKIKIEKEGQQANSFLSDHVLLLGEDAFSNSIPSLEIDADDVKASHGATTGRPDEEEIFYLMARGLKKEEAEKLIISGFFEKVIEKIKNEKIKEKFEAILK